MKYGTKINIIKGVFDGCKGIFFTNLENKKAEIEVFFKTQKVEYSENMGDYFLDYLFNENIPKKTTSAMIRISLDDIKEA